MDRKLVLYMFHFIWLVFTRTQSSNQVSSIRNLISRVFQELENPWGSTKSGMTRKYGRMEKKPFKLLVKMELL